MLSIFHNPGGYKQTISTEIDSNLEGPHVGGPSKVITVSVHHHQEVTRPVEHVFQAYMGSHLRRGLCGFSTVSTPPYITGNSMAPNLAASTAASLCTY